MEKFGTSLRPFDDADTVRKEIFGTTQCIHIRATLQSVEIKMVKPQVAGIFVDQAETGTIHKVFYTQRKGDTFCEPCLSCARLTGQEDDIIFTE